LVPAEYHSKPQSPRKRIVTSCFLCDLGAFA
jgi:hypothetical protein